MKSAESFLAQNGLPKWTKIVRIVQNAETATFKQYFETWSEPQEKSNGLSRTYPVEAIAEWDVGSLHAENSRRLAKSAGSAIGFMPDDSKGKYFLVWHNFALTSDLFFLPSLHSS